MAARNLTLACASNGPVMLIYHMINIMDITNGKNLIFDTWIAISMEERDINHDSLSKGEQLIYKAHGTALSSIFSSIHII